MNSENGATQLSEREATILQAVVHTYILTAEPVGSRVLVKRYGLRLSPATVRNVMADLEERGYLEQVHTSSGRVPTGRGYRYYIDYLMRVQELTLAERARIQGELSGKIADIDEIMRQTSHLLALISNQTGIVEAPDDNDAEVHRVEMVTLGPARVAIILADNLGQVRTVMVTPDEPLSAGEAQRLGRFLTENFRGVTAQRLVEAVRARLGDYLDEQYRLARQALGLLDQIPPSRPGQVFLEGLTQLFEQPEFHDVQKAREVFGLLEGRDRLMELLRAARSDEDMRGALVVIGSELSSPGLHDISIVMAPYRVGGRRVGVIGVLGPRRMHYPRVAGLVGFTADLLSMRLTGISPPAGSDGMNLAEWM